MNEDHDLHDHGAFDPHIWLDPILVKKMAQTIFESLVKIAPERQTDFSDSLESFNKQMDSLHLFLEKKLETLKDNTFFTYHPTLGYFADRYGLKQIAIETEGKEPGAYALGELMRKAKPRENQVIFVQPQFSTRGAKVIADTFNGKIISIDLLPGSFKAYIDMFDLIAEALAEKGNSE
jgi:zinc transport system substrate-binding protein